MHAWHLHAPPRPLLLVVSIGLSVGALLGSPCTLSALGSQATASKTCQPNGPATTDISHAMFVLSTAQTVTWTASFNPVAGCNGNAFYLSHTDPNHADIPLTTSGQISGSQLLPAGTYYISINTFLMGQGGYSVAYNQTATLKVTATSSSGFTVSGSIGSYSALPLGQTSAASPFRVESTGESPIVLSSSQAVTSSDKIHFPITLSPDGQTVPPDQAFHVTFNAGNSAGTFSSDIIAHGSSTLGAQTSVTSSTFHVTGTAFTPIANECFGSIPSFGLVMWGATAMRTLTVTSCGTATLDISGVTWNPTTPWSITAHSPFTALPIHLAPGQSEDFQIAFSPSGSSGDQQFCTTINFAGSDPTPPAGPTVCGTGHTPVPHACYSPVDKLSFGKVAISKTLPLVITDCGDATLAITSVTRVGALTITPAAPPPVAPGTAATLTVTCARANLGLPLNNNPSITITTNDPVNPAHTIAVSCVFPPKTGLPHH